MTYSRTRRQNGDFVCGPEVRWKIASTARKAEGCSLQAFDGDPLTCTTTYVCVYICMYTRPAPPRLLTERRMSCHTCTRVCVCVLLHIIKASAKIKKFFSTFS